MRVRIDVNISHNRSIELMGGGDHVLEVVHFEPEQNAVTDRLCWVANRPVMMIGMPIMQLQDQSVASPFACVVPWVPQSLIFSTPMPSDTAEQSLVPSARLLNVPTKDEWLRAYTIDKSMVAQLSFETTLNARRYGRSTFKT